MCKNEFGSTQVIDWPGATAWPGWVPAAAAHYIRHVEHGLSLRQLARLSGCHPSTVLRQVRRLENRRDDPLVDAALRQLGKSTTAKAPLAKGCPMARSPEFDCTQTDDETLRHEARRILRRLTESGAVLAVVPDMEKAVVVRDTASGSTQRTAVVDTGVAEALALKEWIACKTPGRIARYRITAAGRAALGQLLAQAESGRQIDQAGLAEAQAPFCAAAQPEDRRRKRLRYGAHETPLTLLARRRDKDGARFLTDELVSAGERLREDFEIAQMAPRSTQNWESFLTGGSQTPGRGEGPMASAEARRRVARALGDLGPGLGDVALRCCCYLEGLETTEKRMGWSARSGKIVLRIALQRLRRFYDEVQTGETLIG